MLLDVRTYTVKPGTLAEHLELYQKHGWEVQTKHLGKPLAYLTTETGDPNQYVHIWVYRNAADREKRRAALFADPVWNDYRKKSAKLGALIKQENKLMNPVSFAPVKKPR